MIRRFMPAAVMISALLLTMVACSSNDSTTESSSREAARPLAADRQGFPTPGNAIDGLITLLRSEDLSGLARLLGEDSSDLLFSGDDVEDRNARADFVARYDEAHVVETSDPDTAILYVGTNQWPMPIPVVREGDAWFFDTAAGREEVINRRIGRNELNTIQVCLALSDAQREYAAQDWDGDGVYVYAQHLRSTPGTKDGLYWEAAPGEPQSPVGRLVAAAEAEGYEPGSREEPPPYQGYYYRLLRAQGPHASGGEYGYMAGELMIGGFAIIAWPAQYANSGVKTFLVNHEGVVFEKDLGSSTAETAASINRFDPDSSWSRVSESDLSILEN